jgi:predicted ferric reductase
MNRWLFIFFFVLLFIGAPLLLSISQAVPTQSTFQLVVLLVSLAGAGLALGLFWLSRLTPHGAVNIRLGKMLIWHKYLGYLVGAVFLLHPVLIIARRFWAVESNPIDNLVLLFSSPLVWPGVAAWLLLITLVVTAFARKRFAPTTFRWLHGCLAVAFVSLGVWHVIAVGRHSSLILSAFWIVLAAAAIFAYFNRVFRKRTDHESA